VKLPRPIRNVIFDLDGVLLDTEPLYTKAIAEVAARHGKLYDWSIKSQCIGRGTLEAARVITDGLGLPLSPEELVRQRDLTLLDLLAKAAPMPGAQAFTRALAARGVPMAIATSSESAIFAVKAAAHREWLSLFAAIVCGDDARVRHSKPAPDIFLAAAADLAAEPATCVVFEDSPYGVAGALAAGMQVVAMPDPAMERARYSGAQAIVAGFGEIAIPGNGVEPDSAALTLAISSV
jgi:pseudouridine-5'-monophosphatase